MRWHIVQVIDNFVLNEYTMASSLLRSKEYLTLNIYFC
jgi:hypothetical protein